MGRSSFSIFATVIIICKSWSWANSKFFRLSEMCRFDLIATDSTINIYKYLQEIQAAGFSNVINFPTFALIDRKVSF
ncbi:MAG: hypothetical protein IJG33_05915 [Selenomonadaceae bacterium]|nr:hypothetical protein [Selenomonadaceae bacterium]